MDSASIILFNGQGKILLQLKDSEAPRFANHWAFFGGAIEKGESAIECLKREALEELNYKLKGPVLIKQKVTEEDGTKNYYVEEYDGEQKIDLLEGEKMEWHTIDEAKKLLMIPHNKEELDLIGEKISKIKEI